MHIKKIPFQVISVSGSDPEFPVEGIAKHGPFNTGWQSERFCTFPQQMILKLSEKTRVFKIQLLIHHFKIPTKVEIAISNTQDQFERLGYVSLGDNSKNAYRARELKTVHLDTYCTYLQLSFHRCFVNSLNLYNQVGLVAVNILGNSTSTLDSIVKGVNSSKILNQMRILFCEE
jgi:centrosomal protein CEP104